MINIAVIGCGYWGPNLIRNFMACEKTRLKWACDLDENRLRKVLHPYPNVQPAVSLDDLVTDSELDAVAISTPVNSHYSIARLFLETGRHVLLEKPLAATVAQGEELVEIAQRNNLQLMCDHTFCYTGAVRKIKEIIDSGELGKVIYFDSVRINLGLFQNDVNVVWDLATHDLAILDYLIPARPVEIGAYGVSHAGNAIENIAYVTLKYADAMIAHFHVNWLSPVKIRKTIIGGDQKMLEWNDLEPNEKVKIYDKGIEVSVNELDEKTKLLVSYRSGDIFSPRVDGTEALSLMVEEFADCILENRPAITDGFSALRVLRILEAAEKSIKAGGKNIPLKVV